MKIVFLDAFTLNPDDCFDWSEMQSLGDFQKYDRVSVEEITDVAENAEIIITNKAPLSGETISKLPNLKLICVAATGFNIVDVEAAKNAGILVCNVPSYSSSSVAQLTMSLILGLTNRVESMNSTVKKNWTTSLDFCYGHDSIIDLDGKTLGLIGTGDIAQKVAKIATAFNMTVIGTSKSMKKVERIEVVTLDDLLRKSDFVSLHCPLTPETKEIICNDNIDKMKGNAFIINTARGGLINENDLFGALFINRIAGAGLDVLSVEPPQKGNVLFNAPNCIITPHVAWGSLLSRIKLYNVLIQNIRSFQNQTPQNVVNQ